MSNRSATPSGTLAALALLLGLVAVCTSPTEAGQAQATFQVRVVFTGVAQAPAGCTVITGPSGPVLDCGLVPGGDPGAPPQPPGNGDGGAEPPVVPGDAGDGGIIPPVVQPPADPGSSRRLAVWRVPRGPVQLDGESVSLYHEYSSRLVRNGALEYREDMFSW